MMKSSKFILGKSVPLPPGYELVPPLSRKDGYRKGKISANNPSSDPDVKIKRKSKKTKRIGKRLCEAVIMAAMLNQNKKG